MDQTAALQRAQAWTKPPYDPKTRQEVQKRLNQSDWLLENFGSDLSFGTGGVRALMGLGTAKLNIYTLGCITQGLASYLKKAHPMKPHLSVVVGFDSRLFSEEFAKKTAEVFASNGIYVFLLDKLRPTPFISFACRYMKADAAVMITASHNPKEYNGYKVYWSDGAQVVFPHDVGIIEEVRKVGSFAEVKTGGSPSFITHVQEELDSPYLDAIAALQLHKTHEFHDLKIAYTSLHGTGITLIPQALKRWGFKEIELEEKQTIPDGNFPTVSFPNPEIPEALSLGKALMLKKGCDLLIATDPDADRLGICINHHQEAISFNGNQIAALCLEYVLSTKKAEGMSGKEVVISTIVTTRLLKEITSFYGAVYIDVLTGFKYIAEKIHLFEKEHLPYQFLFGAEESYGYLFGTHARDKDAIIMACLIAEMTLEAKHNGKTLQDKLDEIYQKYGLFEEGQRTQNFPVGAHGMQQMQNCMNTLRQKKLQQIGNQKVLSCKDYLVLPPSQDPLHAIAKADVLEYHLEDGSSILIRPSGTEPKIKIYAGAHLRNFTSLNEGKKQVLVKLGSLLDATQHALQTCL